MLFTCFMFFSMSLSYWSLRVILLDKPIIAKWMMLKDLLWVYGKLETESGLESRTFEFQIKSRLLTICHGLTYSLTTSILKGTVSILLLQARMPGRVNQFMSEHQSNLEGWQGLQYVSCSKPVLSLSYHIICLVIIYATKHCHNRKKTYLLVGSIIITSVSLSIYPT